MIWLSSYNRNDRKIQSNKIWEFFFSESFWDFFSKHASGFSLRIQIFSTDPQQIFRFSILHPLQILLILFLWVLFHNAPKTLFLWHLNALHLSQQCDLNLSQLILWYSVQTLKFFNTFIENFESFGSLGIHVRIKTDISRLSYTWPRSIRPSFLPDLWMQVLLLQVLS